MAITDAPYKYLHVQEQDWFSLTGEVICSWETNLPWPCSAACFQCVFEARRHWRSHLWVCLSHTAPPRVILYVCLPHPPWGSTWVTWSSGCRVRLIETLRRHAVVRGTGLEIGVSRMRRGEVAELQLWQNPRRAQSDSLKAVVKPEANLIGFKQTQSNWIVELVWKVTWPSVPLVYCYVKHQIHSIMLQVYWGIAG